MVTTGRPSEDEWCRSVVSAPGNNNFLLAFLNAKHAITRSVKAMPPATVSAITGMLEERRLDVFLELLFDPDDDATADVDVVVDDNTDVEIVSLSTLFKKRSAGKQWVMTITVTHVRNA